MSTPTHAQIAQEAQQLWSNRGSPAGHDTEIWLEAERKLSDVSAGDTFIERASAEMAAESEIAYDLSPAESQQKSIQAALQAAAARAPQVPHHTGMKAKPPETGKPLWTRPHSN